jgi:hypothetical protein
VPTLAYEQFGKGEKTVIKQRLKAVKELQWEQERLVFMSKI